LLRSSNKKAGLAGLFLCSVGGKIERSKKSVEGVEGNNSLRVPDAGQHLGLLVDEVTHILAVPKITLGQQVIGAGNRIYLGHAIDIDE
jgi:hypothetical protein